MKLFLKILLSILVSLSLNSYAQRPARKEFEANSYDYNGWKIKKSSPIIFSALDTGIIKALSWYSNEEGNFIVAEILLGDSVYVSNLDNDIDEGVILIPTGISKKNTEKDLEKYYSVKIVDSTVKASKSELFVRAQSWIAKNYNSANDVVQFADKDGGKIIVKGLFKVSRGIYIVRHVLTIDMKDNRFRIVMNGFSQEQSPGVTKGGPGGAFTNNRPACGTLFLPMNQWNNLRDEAMDKAKSYSRSLAEEMSLRGEVDKDGF